MEYKLGRITKSIVSTEPIIPQNLSVILHNKVMSMEQIFQDISKRMLETTYTLRLNQLLKITPDFKKYMWQKLKLKKPITMILAKLVVTRSQLLEGPKCESQTKDNRMVRNRGTLFGSQHFRGVKGRARAPRWDQEE